MDKSKKQEVISLKDDFLINELTIKENIKLFSNNKQKDIIKTNILQKNLNNYPNNISKSKRKLIQTLIMIMCKSNSFILKNPFQDLNKKQKKQLLRILNNLSKTKKITVKTNNDIKLEFV